MPKVLLGVCGGIAAYKSCDLVRELQRRGAEVRVVMTKAAQEFVTKLTFEALTHAPVYGDLFNDGAFGTAHIEAARWADRFLVAPATANTLAHMARGEACDFLSTVHLAFRGLVTVAPTMNTAMWEHPATQENLSILKTRGVRVIEPEMGFLACGEIGVGRMPDAPVICDAVLSKAGLPLEGVSVLVTAGATREYLDPVRYLSNPSTGKMGFEVAREAARRGANVTVVHGPTSEKPDFEAEFVPIMTAEGMLRAVEERLPTSIFIGAAAVSDYTPVSPSESKLKKTKDTLTLDLRRTTDIIREVVRRRRPGDLIVGFAAETDNVIPNAKLKLEEKGLDLIVANRVFREIEGFGSGNTSVSILDRKGHAAEHADLSKAEAATVLWNRIEELTNARSK